MRRWSKLQKEVYNLLDPALNLQIHCRVYRKPTQWSTLQLPRYWITLNKEIIFDYPSCFNDLKNVSPPYPYDAAFISEISDIIRDYIDTPKDKLLDLKDKYGIIDILKAADRRLGKENLLSIDLSKPAQKVLKVRFGENYYNTIKKPNNI